jgi:hypothetical protein
MSGTAVGPVLIFGIVLSPVYLMLAGWLLGRPRELRLPLIGIGFLVAFTVLAWSGLAMFGLAVDLLFVS